MAENPQIASSQYPPPIYREAFLRVPLTFPSWALVEVLRLIPQDARLLPDRMFEENGELVIWLKSSYFPCTQEGESPPEIKVLDYTQGNRPGEFRVTLDVPLEESRYMSGSEYVPKKDQQPGGAA